MKKIPLISVGIVVLVQFAWAASETYTISGKILFEKKGDILIELVNEKQFQSNDEADSENKENAILNLHLKIGTKEFTQKEIAFQMVDIPEGTYAITVFQDINGNNRLDEGMFGPKEPWGMSSLSARPKFRAPKFEEAKFVVNKDIKQMLIEVK